MPREQAPIAQPVMAQRAGDEQQQQAQTQVPTADETDYQLLLRESAAARAHGHRVSGQASDVAPPPQQRPSQPYSQVPTRVAAAPLPDAHAKQSQPQSQAQRPSQPSQPVIDDAEFARRLQQEEESRAHPSAAEVAKRRAAEEADAKMARDLQQAEESEQRRVREQSLQAAEHGARERRASEERNVGLSRQNELNSDAALAARMQEQEARSSALSMARENSGDNNQGASDDMGQDGVMLLPPRRDSTEEQFRRARARPALGALSGGDSPGASDYPGQASVLDRQNSARSREQVLRRLHGMQGSYPGLAGAGRSASFRFAPGGHMLVGWDSDEEDQRSGGASAAAAMAAGDDDAARRVAAAEAGGEEVLTAEDAAAQRAAFAQYERENAARQQRQQQHGGGHDGGHDAPDESGGGGFMGMLGGALHRHASNANQGVPFPLSLLLDPEQVRAHQQASMMGRDGVRRYSFSNGGGGSGPSIFVRGPGGLMRVVSRSGAGGGGGGGGAADVDVDHMSYDQLLQLEEALGSVKPRVKPASAGQVASLPVSNFKKHAPPAAAASSSAASAASAAGASSAAAAAASSASSPEDNEEECSICMCPFEDGESVKTLPCFHKFHEAEIDKWLLTNETCPVCRVPVSGASH